MIDTFLKRLADLSQVEQKATREFLQKRVVTAKEELSEAEQKILTLRLSEDLEYVEIAKIMNMTENACRMQYSRARRHCAELLERQKNT